jgi:uncharacterized protein involved in outer membrane biogenesis
MHLRSIRAWLLPLIAAILSVVVVAGSLAFRYLDLDTYKEEIVSQVKSALKRDLRYESGEFSLRYGPSFSFRDVTIKEKDGVGDFVKADRLTIRIALLPLLRKELVLARMHLERPVLQLSRDRDGVFNISDLLTGTPGGTSPGIRGVKLTKARIRFSDAAVSDPPLITEFSDADLYLSRLVRGKSCDFKLSGFLGSGAGRVPLFLGGAAKIPAEGPLSACEVSAKLRTGPLDAGRFWPYYSRYVPFKSLAGQVAIDSSFKGSLAAFKSEGTLQVARLNLDYPKVFHARLTPKLLKASYKLELTGRDLEISSVKVNLDGLSAQGSCRLSDLHSGDLRITAKVSSNRFNLRDFRAYIPYGIIVKDTADFIEQKIPGGIYRLDQGRLDGRISQILHMERGQNYNILSVRAHVEEGEVAYGSGVPLFSGIKGELELAGKDFILRGMTGKFGGSPLALEGRLTDYPLESPTHYLFSSVIHPRQQEAAWLLGRGRGDKLVLESGSTLKLSGEGTSSAYNLSGDWELGAVAYSYPDLIAKPQAKANTLTFKGSFAMDEFRLSALNYHLASLSLSATALNRYQGPMSVEVKTNQFQAAELAPFLPQARKYQPSGRVQAQLHAAGTGLERLVWSGNVALAGASFRAGDKIKPLSGINGQIRIGADSLESPQLTVRLGSSTISGRGTLSGFNSPSFALAFSSPALDLADLGFPHGKLPLKAENLQGYLTYSKDNLQIGSLSGTLGRSILQMKGSVQNLQHPVIDISVTSPHLEIEDLAPLIGPSPAGGSRFTLKAHILATNGKARDIPFQHLKCVLALEEQSLLLQPVDFSTLDGEVSGRMRIDFGSGGPRYQVNCNATKVSAERLLHALGVNKQELTGSLSLQGDLSARGESALDLKKSAVGNIKLKVDHGSVKKFSTLSKVFSILNVSQLLKFHLPDMVTGGMPYNKISGDFAIKDGFASTQNLLMDSNAINVSTVGKFDIVKNELDLVIGVQPLQTVDKVVSRIPIVGWILTGKDHTLISTYFEAKGRIEDPQVTAVPVKSLAKGVFNIFKRVFELPVRLVTDTGEVMIGK